MKCKFPRLAHKSLYIESCHGLKSISRAGQVSLPGTGSRAVLVPGLLDNMNPYLWEEVSQCLRPRLLCHLRTPWHVHFRHILPPLFLEKYCCQLQTVHRAPLFLCMLICVCPVPLRPLKVWTHGWSDKGEVK